MTNYEDQNKILDKCQSHIEKANVDFIDIRYEIKKEIDIGFESADIKEVGSNTTDGYVIRVLNNGGFGLSIVTKPDDIPWAIEKAQEAAKVISTIDRSELADVPVVQDIITLKLEHDPRDVPLEEKMELTRKYNDIMLAQPEISSTSLAYSEVYRQKFYVNSEGTRVAEELMTVSMTGQAVASRDGISQNIRVGIGGSTGMKNLYGRDDVFVRRAEIARELLDAEPVKGGTYTVLLNSSMTGVFAHEAFGHFSEADGLENNKSLREKMQLGLKLGSDKITIVADSTMEGDLGYYQYDDEGVRVKKITLLDKGILTGRLHSRKTAAGFGEKYTGHCIAEDYRYSPIIRMGTIFVEAGDKDFDDLVKEVGDGLYICDAKGGQTVGGNFTFGAQYGYLIKDGKVGPMVRDINMMGNLFTTLENITEVGNDFHLSERGGCGKGQWNIKSAHGGPHMIIKETVVGGV